MEEQPPNTSNNRSSSTGNADTTTTRRRYAYANADTTRYVYAGPAADIVEIGAGSPYYQIPPGGSSTSPERRTREFKDFEYTFMGVATDELPGNNPPPPGSSMRLLASTRIMSSAPAKEEVIDEEVLERTWKVTPDHEPHMMIQRSSSSSSAVVIFKDARPSSWREMVARGKRRLITQQVEGEGGPSLQEAGFAAALGGRALPDEIIFKIMGFLPMMSLHRFLFLNRYWMIRIMRLFYTYSLDSPLPTPLLPLVNRFPIFLSVGSRFRINFTFDLVLRRWDEFRITPDPHTLPPYATVPVAAAGGLICYASWFHPGRYWIANPMTGFSTELMLDYSVQCLMEMGRQHELLIDEDLPETYSLLVVGIFKYCTLDNGLPMDGYGTVVYRSATGKWESYRGPHLQHSLWVRPEGERPENFKEYGPPLDTLVCGRFWYVVAMGDQFVHTFDCIDCVWYMAFKVDLTTDLCAPQLISYHGRAFRVSMLSPHTITIFQLRLDRFFEHGVRLIWRESDLFTDPRFENFLTEMDGASCSTGPDLNDWDPPTRFSCFVHEDLLFIVGKYGRDICQYHFVKKTWDWLPPFPVLRVPGDPKIEVRGFPLYGSFSRKVGVPPIQIQERVFTEEELQAYQAYETKPFFN